MIESVTYVYDKLSFVKALCIVFRLSLNSLEELDDKSIGRNVQHS